MKFNPIAIAKKTITFVVGAGTAKIMHDIIANNVEADTTYQKVAVTSASFAIGGAVSEMTKEYTDAQIDELVDFVKKIKNRKKTEENED